MNISDEAVEAATQRLIDAMSRERGIESPYVDAEDPEDAVIDGRFDVPAIVREVLEAAAPYLMAEAWEEGRRADDFSVSIGFEKNPYLPAGRGGSDG